MEKVRVLNGMQQPIHIKLEIDFLVYLEKIDIFDRLGLMGPAPFQKL